MESELVQEGTGNYLKMVSSMSDEYADRLFSYQEIPGFLPLEIRRINGQKEMFYDVTGKVSLARFLREERFGLSLIRNIFNQIFALEEELEEYLLEGTGLLVHTEYLYIEKSTGRLWGIYRGDRNSGNTPAFGTLLEYIMECMDQKDRELVFFIYGMHKLTRGSGCTRGEMKQYLGTEEAEPGKEEAEPGARPDSEPGAVPGSGRKQGSYIRSGIPEKRRSPKDGKNVKTSTAAGREKEKRDKGSPALSVAILLTGVFLPFVLWRAGVFSRPLSGEMNWEKGIGATAFFLIVTGYGAWKTMPKRDGRGRRTGVRREEETGLWQVCLIPQQSGDALIPVPYFPFTIGRDGDRADVVLPDGGVSGVHLKIVQEDGEVIAVDQESSGGTYHNGKRMVPWKSKKLQDGDSISFGTHEFVVELTAPDSIF